MKKIFTFLFATCCMIGSNFTNAQNGVLAVKNGNVSAVNGAKSTNNKATVLDQQTTSIGFGMGSFRYDALSTANIVQSAEDFVVPAQTQWTIDSLVVQMYWKYSQADSYDVNFYEDNAGKPGALKYTNTGYGFNLPNPLTGYNMKFNIDESVNIFTPGRYWVSVLAVYDTVTSFANGITWWSRDTVITSGLSAKVKDSLLFHFTAPRDWGSVSFYPSNVLTNLNFKLLGTETSTVGISNLSFKNNSISAYPNPAKDQITFATFNSIIKNINVYDVTGSLVETISMNNNTSVVHSLENYSNGVYFYKSVGNNNELIGTGKFIVK